MKCGLLMMGAIVGFLVTVMGSMVVGMGHGDIGYFFSMIGVSLACASVIGLGLDAIRAVLGH